MSSYEIVDAGRNKERIDSIFPMGAASVVLDLTEGTYTQYLYWLG
jgi:hypothetical protein